MTKQFVLETEYSLHVAICEYLRWQYRHVPFQSDLSGIKMTVGQASKYMAVKWGKFWPDLFIAYPSGKYHGLFIELKLDRCLVYKLDGSPREAKHIKGQARMLRQLRRLGYMAEFGLGYDHTKELIDTYLRGKNGLTTNDRNVPAKVD